MTGRFADEERRRGVSTALGVFGAAILFAAVGGFGCADGALTPQAVDGGGEGGDVRVADTDSSCVPGLTRECSCADGSTEIQACRSDGSGWNPCPCSGPTRDSDAGGPSGGDSGDTAPTNGETCDGKDNDGDGITDEQLSKSCPKQQGVCAGASVKCLNGSYATCGASQYGSSYQSNESKCDGSDNDCDGQVDENCACSSGQTQSCGKSTGACQQGTQMCSNGTWGSCMGSVGPSTERCEGSVDEDCDGQTDEGCQCINGNSRTCGQSTGACQTGTRTCSGGQWGSCQGDVGPSSETCNGTDDDCDGSTDEGVGSTYYRDSDGDGYGRSGSTTTACSTPSGYAAQKGDCDDGDAGRNPGATEVCNGTDDDCDGNVDENLNRGSGEPGESCSRDCECRSGVCRPSLNGCSHEIFVTSQEWPGDLGGPGGADNKCEQAAHSAGLDNGDGDWDPVIADSGRSAKSRAGIQASVYNTNGENIDESESAFWNGSLDEPIKYDASGNAVSFDKVWTGMNYDGSADSTAQCDDWTSTGSTANAGDQEKTNSDWAEYGAYGCGGTKHLYCISD